MNYLKAILKSVVPSSVRRKLSGLLYGWHGNYKNWQAARKKCSGYESLNILEKVKSSAMEVRNGRFAYERDSVLFNEIHYSFPMLSSLMWIAAVNKGRLNVLDFGGSLGSGYYQNKEFIDSLPDSKWYIVEQPSFTKTGKEYFENSRLRFFYSLEECLSSSEIDVILLSSVIQYLENPYDFIELIKSKKIGYVLIDRTPFIKGNDRITVQKVEPWIYKASYPCWFFNKEKFLDYFKPEYDLVLEFNALDTANIRSEFKGFLFRRNFILHQE